MFNTLFVAFAQRRVEIQGLVYEAIEKWGPLGPEEYQAKARSLSPFARSAMKATARELRESDETNRDALDRLIGALE